MSIVYEEYCALPINGDMIDSFSDVSSLKSIRKNEAPDYFINSSILISILSMKIFGKRIFAKDVNFDVKMFIKKNPGLICLIMINFLLYIVLVYSIMLLK